MNVSEFMSSWFVWTRNTIRYWFFRLVMAILTRRFPLSLDDHPRRRYAGGPMMSPALQVLYDEIARPDDVIVNTAPKVR